MSRRAKLALASLALAVAPMGCSSTAPTRGYAVHSSGGSMVAADSLGALVFRSDNATASAWTPYAGRLDPPMAPDGGPQLASYPDE